MQTTLLIAGLACIVAAIVGGGVKLLGIEVPVFLPGWRQVVLGALGLLLAGYALWLGRPPGREPVVLTRGTWTLINAVDDGGRDWSNSTLKFTAQEKVSDGFRLAGYFEWRVEDVLVGKEHFNGHFDPSNAEIILEGTSITQESSHKATLLGKGSYSARLSPDGMKLTNGHWGSVTGVADPNVRGHWEATR
jgi:hypothetical protein